jgi:hypothetical protein
MGHPDSMGMHIRRRTVPWVWSGHTTAVLGRPVGRACTGSAGVAQA